MIFLRTKRKERRLGKNLTVVQTKLRVNRLRAIRIRKVCESMQFDSGPDVFVPVNRNYVSTEYVLNENDCIARQPALSSLQSPCMSASIDTTFDHLCIGKKGQRKREKN